MQEPIDLAIVGAGPAGLAAAHYARRAGLHAEVFEAGSRPGGKVTSLREDGFVIEGGPQGWLDREPEIKEVCEQLGLEVLPAAPTAGERYLLRRGGLHAAPMGPVAFLKSRLLSVRGRLRVLGEPFMRKRKDGADESILDFASRRIGKEAAEVLVGAMVSGIHAGDIAELSLPASFPVLAEIEQEYGSLFRGMVARRKKARGGPGGPSGELLSLPEGMGSLTETLATACGPSLHLDTPLEGIEQDEAGWRLLSRGAAIARAQHVLLCVPAAAAASILAGIEPGLAAVAAQMEVASMATVAAAFPRDRVGHPCSGFGFLAPRLEGFRPLGVLFVHSIFPRHAPPGQLLLRVMLGGAHDPDAVGLDDEQLEAAALDPLRELLEISGKPARLWIKRIPAAAPQYKLGQMQRAALFQEAAGRHPGLHIVGDSFCGIGVNPAFKHARLKVEELARGLAARPRRAPAA